MASGGVLALRPAHGEATLLGPRLARAARGSGHLGPGGARERKRCADGRAAAFARADADAAAVHRDTLAHPAQTDVAGLGEVARGDAAAIVAHFQRDAARGPGEANRNCAGLRVLGDVVERLLC